MTTHSIVSAALMKRNQIVVGGGGEDEAAASTYCLFEKTQGKNRMVVDGTLGSSNGFVKEGRLECV